MFKFNFSQENDKESKLKSVDSTPCVKENLKYYPAEQVYFQDEDYDRTTDRLQNSSLNVFMSEGDYEISYLVLETSEISGNAQKADASHSDLIPGVYEGGLKIWECTKDLCDYLTESLPLVESEKSEHVFKIPGVVVEEEVNTLIKSFQHKLCLDLGCGAGILGILCLQNGAKVHFQDYNKEVIEKVTYPNTILNIEDNEELTKDSIKNCKFYSGDWASFSKLTQDDEKYDIILTSETIYSPENYMKLLDLFKNRLKSDGIIYLGAKTVYFGVGGCISEFEKALNIDETFNCEKAWTCESGVLREILKISFKSNNL